MIWVTRTDKYYSTPFSWFSVSWIQWPHWQMHELHFPNQWSMLVFLVFRGRNVVCIDTEAFVFCLPPNPPSGQIIGEHLKMTRITKRCWSNNLHPGNYSKMYLVSIDLTVTSYTKLVPNLQCMAQPLVRGNQLLQLIQLLLSVLRWGISQLDIRSKWQRPWILQICQSLPKLHLWQQDLKENKSNH